MSILDLARWLCLPVLCGALLVAQQPEAEPTTLDADCAAFSGYDLDDDGHAEIEDLRPLHRTQPERAARVLALVEAPLVTDPGLRSRLWRWADDVADGGFGCDLVAARLQAAGAERHQDGRTLLALRRFVQARYEHGDLRGVVLIGRFPDALLVRTVSWRKRGKLVTGKGTSEEHDWGKVRYLRRVPELVAHRCDMVLADLDGHWEDVYVQPETTLPTLYAVFDGPVPDGGGEALAVDTGNVRYRDFFHVADGSCEVDGKEVTLDADARDAECTAADRECGNPLARAEIFVSRIDARGAAWGPRERIAGRPLCDEAGFPLAVDLPDGEKPDPARHLWRPDRELELRLLREYFDDNHRYRTTPAGDSHRPASVAHGLGSGMRRLRRADPRWVDGELPGELDLRRGVGLAELTDWVQRPATLRTLRAHSGPRHAAFAKTRDATPLHERLQGPPAAWIRRGGKLRPSLAGEVRRGRAGFVYWRALWECDAAGDEPWLLLHHGCQALSPPGSGRLPYDHRDYDRQGHAASLLFFTPAVAIVGRAKVFYDNPRGFVAALGDGETCGDAWRRYAEIESQAESFGKVGGDIGRKRSYFWSVVGDATLRLRPR